MQEGGDAMTKPTEDKPETVPAKATRDGDILLRWSWVELRVWTERMLTALESGVKGGRPNSFFTTQGLYSLKTAHVLARQSSLR